MKGSSDGLEALFPDLLVLSQIAYLILTKVSDLQILQEATADDHDEISETASMRIETLTNIDVSSQPSALSVNGEGDDEEGDVYVSESDNFLTKEMESEADVRESTGYGVCAAIFSSIFLTHRI